MINFRGILVNFLPAGSTENQGTILVLVLSIVLTATLVIVWRGDWDASTDRFPRQVLATLIVAMFTGFHNHIHGATLLIVPALAVIAGYRTRDPLIGLFGLAVFLPTFVFCLLVMPRFAAWVLMVLMACMYGLICLEPRRRLAPWLRPHTEVDHLPPCDSGTTLHRRSLISTSRTIVPEVASVMAGRSVCPQDSVESKRGVPIDMLSPLDRPVRGLANFVGLWPA